MHAGDIYRHERFYRDAETGELKRKYLVLLAPLPGGDWIIGLLTSQEALRAQQPLCDHRDPRPGYYLGVPGDPLTRKTWVDLRALYDLDRSDLVGREKKGIMCLVSKMPRDVLIEVLECAANARDATRRQERALRDQLVRLR